MCDLNRSVKAKIKTVYKICTVVNDDYYAPLSGKKLEIGLVAELPFFSDSMIRETYMSQWYSDVLHEVDVDGYNWVFRDYRMGSDFYNELAINRVTGFAKLKDAKDVKREFLNKMLIIIKMKIADDIVEGTAKGMGAPNAENMQVYAGKRILEIETLD